MDGALNDTDTKLPLIVCKYNFNDTKYNNLNAATSSFRKDKFKASIAD